MILEKAYVKYDKKGNYDVTLNSEYIEFETEEQARKFVEQNIEKNVEYYFYNTKKDIEDCNFFDDIICNYILNDMEKAEKLENEIEELKKEIEYEEKRLDVCGYGTSDLYYLESLKNRLEELENLLDEI